MCLIDFLLFYLHSETLTLWRSAEEQQSLSRVNTPKRKESTSSSSIGGNGGGVRVLPPVRFSASQDCLVSSGKVSWIEIHCVILIVLCSFWPLFSCS